MRVLTKVIAGGVAAAALICAAPAAAQYYPGYPGYGYGGNPVGQIINQVFGGGYGYNQQALVSQCAAAVQQRLSGGYGGYGSGYSRYSYGPGAHVLGVSRVEPRSSGGLTVRGVATSGRFAGYGYGYGGQDQVDLTWKCRADYRGFITDIDVDPARGNPGYGNYQPYNNDYNYDYSQYGYHRY
jgi:hypothetical protein